MSNRLSLTAPKPPGVDRRRENRLRRWADREGLILRRSKARNPDVIHHGCYWVATVDNNTLLTSEYGVDLDAVECFLADWPAR